MYLEMRAETAEIHRLSEISQRSLLEIGPQGGGTAYAVTGVLVSNARVRAEHDEKWGAELDKDHKRN